MTPKDRPPPPPATLSNRDKMKDAVQQLMQQVNDGKAQGRAEAQRAKAQQQRKQRMRALQVIILTLGFVASTIFGYNLWKEPFPAPTGEAAAHDARKTLVFAAGLVNQYQRRTGELPGTISQLGVVLPGITYQRSGDTYVLSTSVDGHPITYHKGDDPAQFIQGR